MGDNGKHESSFQERLKEILTLPQPSQEDLEKIIQYKKDHPEFSLILGRLAALESMLLGLIKAMGGQVTTPQQRIIKPGFGIVKNPGRTN